MGTSSDQENTRALATQLLCRIALLIDGSGGLSPARHDPKCISWSDLPEVQLKGRLVDNMFMSPWDDACQLLFEAGIMAPKEEVREARGAFECYFRFTQNLKDIPHAPCLNQLTGSEDPFLIRLLTVFLEIATEYGNALPTTHRPFSCPDRWMPDMILMSSNGYAFRIEDKFVWSQKISPMMQEANIWSSENRYQKEIEASQDQQTATAMWNSIPDHLVDRVFTAPRAKRVAALTAVILIFWDFRIGDWTDEEQFPYRPSHAIKLARIVESWGALDG